MNRWENSDYYLRTFSQLLQAGLTTVRRVDIPAARMLTIGSNPLSLLSCPSGYSIFPRTMVFIKQAGPAFTFAAQTIQIQYNVATFPSPHQMTALAGVLDQTTEVSAIQSTNVPTAINGTVRNPVQGIGWRVTTSTGVDYGGVGSDCTFLFGVIYMPTQLSLIGGPSTPLP